MFAENERQIFDYLDWDGTKVYADPASVLRRFKEKTKGQFNTLIKVAADKNPEVSSPAVEQICEAVVYAFDIKKRFDQATGEGWLEMHLLALGDRFNNYINALKKNTAASATGSQPTAG